MENTKYTEESSKSIVACMNPETVQICKENTE